MIMIPECLFSTVKPYNVDKANFSRLSKHNAIVAKIMEFLTTGRHQTSKGLPRLLLHKQQAITRPSFRKVSLKGTKIFKGGRKVLGGGGKMWRSGGQC